MIRKRTHSLTDLYEADETAWRDTMADLIRAGQFTDLDYAHLAEYLEDMAKRDRKEVSSRLRILLIHVLKWIYQKKKRTASWQTTVLDQQAELEDDMEGGVLRKHAEESLEAIFQKARKYAGQQTKLPAATFPAECPWSLDELLAPEVMEE